MSQDFIKIQQDYLTAAGQSEFERLKWRQFALQMLTSWLEGYSLVPANLAAVGKKVNIVDEYGTVIKKIHSYGIAIHGFFILGLDEDDEEVFKRTLNFTQKMRLESAQFAWPVPYPGTALYESLDRAGRIVTKDWSLYTSNVVFEPKLMSREMLKKGHDWAWREFYCLPSIWRRIGIARRNFVTFWVMNLSFRAAWGRKSRSGGFVSPRLTGI